MKEQWLISYQTQTLKSIFSRLRANQSLKLTEIAVDDSTRANQPVTCWTGIVSRGLASVAAALRRRSLAPVR